MEKEKIIDKLFMTKVDEGGVYKWGRKNKSYNKYRKNFKTYEKNLLDFANKQLDNKGYKTFEILLEGLKGAIYDFELEEKKYYFKEGRKEGVLEMKELFR